MSTIRNTGITDNRDFWYTCYVAIASKTIITYHGRTRSQKNDFLPDCVALNTASTTRPPNIDAMSTHRLRCCPNIEPTLGERLV